jgi:hypothetical protein
VIDQGIIAGAPSPTAILSANRLLPREYNKNALVFPLEKPHFTMQAGRWKIVVDVSATISPAAYMPPNGVPGRYSVFDSLRITVNAVEMTAEEVSEMIRQDEVKKTKEVERIKPPKKKSLIAALIAGQCSCS